MAKHYNLYYIFREDCKRHPLSEKAKRRIKRAILKYRKNGSG